MSSPAIVISDVELVEYAGHGTNERREYFIKGTPHMILHDSGYPVKLILNRRKAVNNPAGESPMFVSETTETHEFKTIEEAVDFYKTWRLDRYSLVLKEPWKDDRQPVRLIMLFALESYGYQGWQLCLYDTYENRDGDHLKTFSGGFGTGVKLSWLWFKGGYSSSMPRDRYIPEPATKYFDDPSLCHKQALERFIYQVKMYSRDNRFSFTRQELAKIRDFYRRRFWREGLEETSK